MSFLTIDLRKQLHTADTLDMPEWALRHACYSYSTGWNISRKKRNSYSKLSFRPMLPKVGDSSPLWALLIWKGVLGVFFYFIWGVMNILRWRWACINFFRSSKFIQYWLQKKISERNLKLWEAIKLFSITFPTFYTVECGFNILHSFLLDKETTWKLQNEIYNYF